jgi:hypothetical protein
MLAAWPAAALACPICFNVAEGPVTDGVRTAVIVLMTITVSVLSCFGWFIAGFVRRARANEGVIGRSEHQARGLKPQAPSPQPILEVAP